MAHYFFIRLEKLLFSFPSTNLLGVDVGGEGRVLAALYFLAQRVQVHLVAVEGWLEGGHLVEEAPERPDVRPEVVAGFVDALRWHVVRRSDWQVKTEIKKYKSIKSNIKGLGQLKILRGHNCKRGKGCE